MFDLYLYFFNIYLQGFSTGLHISPLNTFFCGIENWWGNRVNITSPRTKHLLINLKAQNNSRYSNLIALLYYVVVYDWSIKLLVFFLRAYNPIIINKNLDLETI